MPGVTDSLMVSLEQEDIGIDRKTGSDHNEIGFHIMKVSQAKY